MMELIESETFKFTPLPILHQLILQLTEVFVGGEGAVPFCVLIALTTKIRTRPFPFMPALPKIQGEPLTVFVG